MSGYQTTLTTARWHVVLRSRRVAPQYFRLFYRRRNVLGAPQLFRFICDVPKTIIGCQRQFRRSVCKNHGGSLESLHPSTNNVKVDSLTFLLSPLMKVAFTRLEMSDSEHLANRPRPQGHFLPRTSLNLGLRTNRF